MLYHVAPVGEGSETVLHFNRLKPYLSPCPDPSPTQDDCIPGPPRQLEGVPCRGGINKSAADVLQQRQSSPPDCATSVLQPTVHRGEQEAVGPLQGLNSGAMGGETPGGKEGIRAPDGYRGERDMSAPLEQHSGCTYCCQEGGTVNLTLHKKCVLYVRERHLCGQGTMICHVNSRTSPLS